ncbi:hypothetical protein DM02DRAFT_686096 [Periconia macrospinosa]|uniref:Rhodopsin domain-containing protein n=1 Tax=Periconia macrospinosa TaxID=97972 RepID=A0A2V1DFY0_9PLEO|nr:hypothetical protein DM02DRAFT_686096 [Periconia macrospinosa]
MAPPSPEQLRYMREHIDDDRRPMILGLQSGFLILGFLSVALRFGSRIKIGARLQADDWLIFIAVKYRGPSDIWMSPFRMQSSVSLCGHATACMSTVQWGMGRHVILVTDRASMSKTSLAATSFYSCTLVFTKLSILALYHRIFHLTRGWVPTLWGIAVFVIVLGIVQPLVYIFQCIPVSALWTEGPDSIRCVKFGLAIVLLGSIHIITDWVILLLPIPVVLGLQLNQRAKWMICSLFAVGGVVCIISIVRLVKAISINMVDPSWDNVPIQVLSTVEGSAGILAACMPTWRPLFRFVGQGINHYFSNGSQHGRYNGAKKSHASTSLGRSPNPSHAHSPSPNLEKNGSAPPSPFTTDANCYPGANNTGPYLDPASANTNVYPSAPSPVRSSPRVSWKTRPKRGESDSGDSIERMLQGRTHGMPAEDVELGDMSSSSEDLEMRTAMRVNITPALVR